MSRAKALSPVLVSVRYPAAGKPPGSHRIHAASTRIVGFGAAGEFARAGFEPVGFEPVGPASAGAPTINAPMAIAVKERSAGRRKRSAMVSEPCQKGTPASSGEKPAFTFRRPSKRADPCTDKKLQ